MCIRDRYIAPSPDKPHTAPDKDDKFKAYIRVADENILANEVLVLAWQKKQDVYKRQTNMGGSMRLGAYDCILKKGSKAYEAYGQTPVSYTHLVFILSIYCLIASCRFRCVSSLCRLNCSIEFLVCLIL